MIILITGASHTGKTALAQRLLEKHGFPYLSIDHLKMGLIRSGNTNLTPLSDDSDLTEYLWPVVCEMIKTAIENKQNLIVEGCYVPSDWQKDFEDEYLENIKFICLVMSEKYIKNHFEDIKRYGNVIENRLFDGDLTKENLKNDNKYYQNMCESQDLPYILIDEKYEIDVI
jgi:2-phosphoglycerate kinase